MNNNSIQIDRYLQNEMTAEERAAFEKQLAADPALQTELSIQQRITNAAMHAGLKNEFASAIRKRMISRRILQWGVPALVIVAAFTIYAVKTNLFKTNKENTVTPETEHFSIINARDTIIETNDGVIFAIPAGAFGTEKDNIELEIKTALDPEKIMRCGLSTMSDSSFLRTAGMFAIDGYADGKKLSLNKEISVSVPAKEIDPAMQLFDGKEDSNGRINWVDPKPISRNLRTYDITKLDFYPPKYIPTVKAQGKNYRDKKYTDSLYYSFSGYPNFINNQSPADVQKEIVIMPVADTVASKNIIVPDSAKKPVLKLDSIVKLNEVTVNSGTLNANIISPSNYTVDFTTGFHYEIDPAKIHAIWDPKFNNTILATKEFEERLRYIHSTCNWLNSERYAGYLDIYTKNLGKPLSEIDQLCANFSEGEVKKKFLTFAARKDGGVQIANGLQQKLSIYIQQKAEAYREAAKKTWDKYQAELEALNKIADAKKREAAYTDLKRKQNNYNEELCANLTDAYRQIGIKRECGDTTVPVPQPPAETYYNITISTPGWKNLDAYVTEATTSRESMEYRDPSNNGLYAKITYSPVEISIENESAYDKVYVYLIPNGLNSFQRLDKKGTGYPEKLNSLFTYDAIVLAYKGTQISFYKEALLKPGTYSWKLKEADEATIHEAIKDYSISKTTDLKSEFEYRLFEQQEVLRQAQLQKDKDFRDNIASSIFPCFEGFQK